MTWLTDWWHWRTERQLLMERLKSAEERVKQLQRNGEINSRTIAMYGHELRLAHAALRRKGQALKRLHKQRHAGGHHEG